MVGLLRRHPELRRVFLAHSVSRAGDAFNVVALVVLVFRLTGSGSGVATTVAFEVAPVLLLGPIVGIVVDRYPRRRVMVAADLARAVLAASLVLWPGPVGWVFAVAFGLSVGSMLFNPAAASLVPELVDDDDLVTANSALWTVAVTAQIALAPLAGVVIGAFGIGWAFAANAGSYLISALLLTRLAAGRQPAGSGTASAWESLREGVSAVRSQPLLARLAVVQALAALSAGATSGLLVVLAAERLGVGPSGFGSLLSAIGIGAVLGPVLLRRVIVAGSRRWLYGPFAARGVVDLLLAATSNPVAAGAGLGLYGVSTSTGMVAYQSTLQTAVPGRLRGRAFVLYDVIWNAMRLVSLGLGGVLADTLGVRWVYVGGGVLLLMAAAIGSAAPTAPDGPLRSERRTAPARRR